MSVGLNSGGAALEYDSVVLLTVPHYVPAFLIILAGKFWQTVLSLHLLQIGCSYRSLGLLGMVGGVGSIAVSVPCGKFVERFGPRAGLLMTSALFVVTALITAFGTMHAETMEDPLDHKTLVYFGVFCLSYFLFNAAEQAGFLCRNIFTSATVPASSRGRVNSLTTGLKAVANVIAPLVSGALASNLQTPCVFFAQAAITLAGALSVYCFTPWIDAQQDATTGKKTAEDAKNDATPVESVVCEHITVLSRISFVAGMLMFARRARDLLFPILGHALQLSQSKVGGVAAVSYAVESTMFPMAGYMIDNFGRRCTVFTNLLMFAVSLLVSRGGTLAFFYFYAVVAGIAGGSMGGIVDTLGADAAPARCRSIFLSLFRTFSRVSDLVAPLVIAVLAGSCSLPVAQLSMSGICMCGAVAAPCCILEPSSFLLSSESSSKEAELASMLEDQHHEEHEPEDEPALE